MDLADGLIVLAIATVILLALLCWVANHGTPDFDVKLSEEHFKVRNHEWRDQ